MKSEQMTPQPSETNVPKRPVRRTPMMEFRTTTSHEPVIVPAKILTRATVFVREARERAAVITGQ